MIILRIRQLRQESGYTQQELGKKIGQTKSNISKYETGALEPGIDTLKTLSRIFNVSLDYLLCNSEIKNPSETKETINKDNEYTKEEKKEIENFKRFILSKRNNE